MGRPKTQDTSVKVTKEVSYQWEHAGHSIQFELGGSTDSSFTVDVKEEDHGDNESIRCTLNRRELIALRLLIDRALTDTESEVR